MLSKRLHWLTVPRLEIPGSRSLHLVYRQKFRFPQNEYFLEDHHAGHDSTFMIPLKTLENVKSFEFLVFDKNLNAGSLELSLKQFCIIVPGLHKLLMKNLLLFSIGTFL